MCFTQAITRGSEIYKELLNASLVPLEPSLLNPAIDEAWGRQIRCNSNHADGSCHADLGTCNSEQFSRIKTYKCQLGFQNTCLLKCDRSQLMQRLFTKEALAKCTNHVQCLECNNASTDKQPFACENKQSTTSSEDVKTKWNHCSIFDMVPMDLMEFYQQNESQFWLCKKCYKRHLDHMTVVCKPCHVQYRSKLSFNIPTSGNLKKKI